MQRGGDGVNYPVNEIFDSLQGEGARTGTPSTFIRLQGCPVGCAWCDTKHTWEVGREVSIDAMLAKTHVPSDQYAVMSETELVAQMRARTRAGGSVVITGGEPAIHNLHPLTEALSDACFECQVETSGTFPLYVSAATWVTCSPKINMPGGLKLDRASVLRADEIKMPIGKRRDIDLLLQEVLPLARRAPIVSLQPLSQSKKATALCIAEAAKHGWSVSIQTHKYLELR